MNRVKRTFLFEVEEDITDDETNNENEVLNQMLNNTSNQSYFLIYLGLFFIHKQ